VALYRIAKEVTGERFGPNKKTKKDMVGSFIRHGLTEREIRGEILLQLFAIPLQGSTRYRLT
jgi:hypothetical protein